MPNMYNDPAGGTPSTIEGPGSSQMNTFLWDRQSLVEARKEMFFMPLADRRTMPKHMGKKIKLYHYLPLLDDRNVNDQGIDANGVTIDMNSYTVEVKKLAWEFAVEQDATDAAAAVNAVTSGVATKTGSSNPWTVTWDPGKVEGATSTEADAIKAAFPDAVVTQGSGNLYGSSKDIGRITEKLPLVGEEGGRVNRVGFKRIQLEGSMFKLGMFHEFTQESLDFDSDAELYQHMSRELVSGAVQLTEALLQRDLLNAAGVVVYAGAATADDEITGEGTVSEVDYDDLQRLSRILTDNRTPMTTKIIAGSRMTDTKTVARGRLMYIGSELESVVEGMKDQFQERAFIPIQKYADAATIMNGEIGSVGHFRIIVVPEMLHWAGAGADEDSNPGYRATGGKYDVFPMLTIGDASFTTIGFAYSGRKHKFKIITKMPGEKTADFNDPYGEKGFSSLKFWYGFMPYRTERIGLIKTVAKI